MHKALKQFLITFILGCFIFVIGEILDNQFEYSTTNLLLQSFLIYQLYTFIIGYSNMAFFNYFTNWKWKTNSIVKRIIIAVLGATAVTLLAIFITRLFLKMVVYNYSFVQFFNTESWQGYSFGFWITMPIMNVFYGVYFYNTYQKTKLNEQKVIAGSASAQFNALKNQLDPHFLFNSLNVLTSLIEENPNAAQKFTTSLSKVYRYVLEQKNKTLVNVNEELDFAKTYMTLLKMRFEDSIVFTMPQTAKHPKSKVVPLALQLLLENAVKHNVVMSSKPLHIKIYEDNGYLIVVNNLQPKQILHKSSGVGLNNIKQRYQIITNTNVNITKTATEFLVAIPILTQPIKIQSMYTTTKANKSSYLRARKRVEALKEFYYSLIFYIMVIPLLIFIWSKYSYYTIQWFWFPLVGWGISLLFQAYKVFINNGALGADWEAKKIQQYMNQDYTEK